MENYSPYSKPKSPTLDSNVLKLVENMSNSESQ